VQEESTWPSDDEADSFGEEAMEMEGTAGPGAGQGEGPSPEEDRADAGYINVFLLKYVCPQADCFGTMVPNGPASSLHKCNMCGFRRTEAQFLADLEASHGG